MDAFVLLWYDRTLVGHLMVFVDHRVVDGDRGRRYVAVTSVVRHRRGGHAGSVRSSYRNGFGVSRGRSDDGNRRSTRDEVLHAKVMRRRNEW